MSLFKGTHTVTRANKISNFTVATAEYGAPVMEVLGTTRISGNVIYYDDFTAHEHRETQKSGKGGKSKSTSITYTYTVAVILGLCEGPVAGIGKIWKDKEIYNYPDDNVPLTLFTGTADQQPWAYVVGKHPERALAYENLAYMAGVIDLGDSASMPSYNFEVRGKLLNTGDGIDVNPMDYILYVLSKVGQSNATFYGADNFRRYCAEADLLISTPADATGTDEAQKIVNEIAELCGAYVFWSNDAYKIVPLADRPVGIWEPDHTIRYDLTVDDFIPQNGSCITWARKDSSEQYNRFTVEFMNRENNYEKESVTYEDAADIAERGVKQAPTINAGYIYTKERAVVIAEAAARRNKVGKNQYQFKLGWAFCRLEPGDLVRITDEASGIIDQVVLIKDIQEDAKGLLSVTAISWFANDYGAAEYDVHEVDRPSIDFNVPPGDTATPVIFQPPADLTTNGLEVWIAAKGQTNNWGGCTVYVSDDGEYYRTLGQITNNARFGPLATDITADATSLEVTVNGTMLSGTQQDAERANTLIWIDGECMSYQTATLLQNGNYRLDGLIRGQYNTTATAHNSGAIMVRCDETLLRAPFFKEDIGKTLYLKFCSFNIFGAAEQSLADVNAYEYTLLPYYIPPVTELTARNRYRKLKDGVHRYDIVVEWTPPNLQSYLEGRVWYKTNAGQSKSLTFQKDVPSSEAGFSGEWIFGGNGKNTVVIPQALVGDTYRIAVTTTDVWGVETSPDASPQIEILVALKTETPNTPDGFAISFGAAAVAEWSEVANTDIAYYEVRNDTNHGIESINLLARVTGLTATLPLTQRSGTLYLYAYSASGKYSAPAILEYNKPAPPTPNAPTLTNKLGGFALVAGAIPSGCNGMNIYIDGAELVQVHTENNTYTHTCDAGIYDVSIAYTDIFGEGTHSEESRITIKATVDSSLLEAQAVTRAKLETALQDAVDNANNSVTEIQRIDGIIGTVEDELDAIDAKASGIITELQKAPSQSGYKSISDLIVEDNNIRSMVATQVQTLDGRITTMGTSISSNEREINLIAANLNKSPGSTGYNAISSLTVDIGNIKTQVEEIYEMTDEGIAPDIATMKSAITQNSRDIDLVVENLNSSADGNTYDSIANLYIAADGISSTVQEFKTSQNAINAGTASSGLLTKINQNASSISAAVQRIGDAETDISALEVRADGISSTVTSNKTAQDKINAGTASSGLLTKINQNASGISAIVTNLGDSTKAGKAYSAIKVMQDGIASKVTQDDVTSYFQQDHTGFYIKGSLINIDGTTKIGNNVITKNMIQTGAVTADKIAVNKLSAINANVGALKGGTITGTTLIGSTIRNSDSSFVVDSKGNIKGAKLTAGTIEANMITSAGFRVKSATIIEGTVSGNKGNVPLPSGYTWEQCLCVAYLPAYTLSKPDSGDHDKWSGIETYSQVVSTSSGKRLQVFCKNWRRNLSEQWVDVTYRVIGIK